MHIELGTITSKGQTTIPAILRKSFNLNAGDKIIFEEDDDRIIIRKLKQHDISYLKSLEKTISEEWDSKADNEAYNDL